MTLIVAYVDNLSRGEIRLTFVNTKLTLTTLETVVPERVERDFNIRVELCNFAQILN